MNGTYPDQGLCPLHADGISHLIKTIGAAKKNAVDKATSDD